MKAVQLTGPRKLEFIEAPTPTPADGQVLLKIEQASVCGSDTHLSYEPVLPEERYPSVPGAPCHEIAGTIVESRNPDYQVGQRAIVLPDYNPETGPSGGGLAEYIASSRIIALPDHGGLDEWVMCQPSGTVLYSARQWGNASDKRIAILGQGAIGLSFTMIAAAQGARQVIAIDLEDYRLDKAKEMGATDIINADKENVAEAIQEMTKGEGVDVVADASGDPEGLNQAVSLVNRFGLIVGFSLVSATEPVVFTQQAWMRKSARLAPTVSGASPTPTEAIEKMVALRDRGWADPAKLITHRVGWDGIPDAYEMYANRSDQVIKVVMDING